MIRESVFQVVHLLHEILFELSLIKPGLGAVCCHSGVHFSPAWLALALCLVLLLTLQVLQRLVHLFRVASVAAYL